MKHLPPIGYSIAPLSPETHLFEVRCTVADPDPEGQQFALPAWIPGSYLVRDFACHVVAIGASSGRRPLGREDRRCEIEILPPKGARYRAWRVATLMRRNEARAWGFGGYAAADYDELIDHPVEMGECSVASFRADGVPHDVVITGSLRLDTARVARDLKRLCEHQIRFFGKPAPMDRYVFLVTAVGEGYGGLEHRASAALLCARDALPQPGMRAATESYRGFNLPLTRSDRPRRGA